MYICSQIIIKQKDMNANELRIGNKLQKISGDIFTISKLDQTQDVLVKEERGLLTLGYNLIGIPLTEELLLKCGFKKSRNIGCYDTDKDAFFFESDKISLTIDFILSSSNHYYRSNPVDGAIPLKYLHQLQNLVFLVTGQELEINL